MSGACLRSPGGQISFDAPSSLSRARWQPWLLGFAIWTVLDRARHPVGFGCRRHCAAASAGTKNGADRDRLIDA
jgi:hypothetical protein